MKPGFSSCNFSIYYRVHSISVFFIFFIRSSCFRLSRFLTSNVKLPKSPPCSLLNMLIILRGFTLFSCSNLDKSISASFMCLWLRKNLVSDFSHRLMQYVLIKFIHENIIFFLQICFSSIRVSSSLKLLIATMNFQNFETLETRVLDITSFSS